MKKLFIKNKNQKGYAILFTIVIVSAVSVITAGLTNAAYKQLVLSSLAKDSQSAFYQADTASDCALYADRVQTKNTPTLFTSGGDWTCGTTSATANLTVTPGVNGSFTIDPKGTLATDSTPCFRIDVTKDVSAPPIIHTTIKAKGYNICNKTNLRTVEREIQINYED
jgi:hypothetical protein